MFTYLTLDQIVACQRYPFTKAQIRHFLMNRNENGLDNVIRQIGKRIYFREDLFQQWIESFDEKKIDKCTGTE